MKKINFSFLLMALTILTNCEAPPKIIAQWSQDPNTNSCIPKPGYERVPIAATDGDGGVIVAWDDGDSFLDIWANRIDKYGYPRWGINGVRISPARGARDVTHVISDGCGGAIIIWDDCTKAWKENPGAEIFENEIYAQRIDSNGKILWDSSGVLMRSKMNSTTCGAFQVITSDNKTFIITWSDDRNPHLNSLDFYGQKVDLNGKIYWAENGKRLTTEDNIYNNRYDIFSDRERGFLVVRFNPNANQDVIVGRYSEEGELVWPSGYVHANTGGAFQACSDEKGGVIIVGAYYPGGGDIGEGRMQRIDHDGHLCWTDSAIVFLKNKNLHLSYRIVPTLNSGAIVSWTDDTRFNNLYFERNFIGFDSTGMIIWNKTGFEYGHTSIYEPIAVSDGFGNMMLIINDWKKNAETREGYQLVFNIDTSGNAVWGREGVMFRHRPYNDWPTTMVGVADGQGGVIVVWYEGHQHTGFDVTLQQINYKGELGNVITKVKSAAVVPNTDEVIVDQNYPNPFNPDTEISIIINKPTRITCRIFDINGREVVALVANKLCFNNEMIKWNGRNATGQLVSSGIYFYEVISDQTRIVRKMIFIH